VRTCAHVCERECMCPRTFMCMCVCTGECRPSTQVLWSAHPSVTCRIVPALAATIFGIYGFFMSVVLLTLLFAIMNDTYYRIKDAEEAEVGWAAACVACSRQAAGTNAGEATAAGF